MPFSPSQVEHEARELRRLYADLEDELLALVAGRIATGIDTPRWAVEQLGAARSIQEAIRAHLDRMTTLGTERLGTLVQQAYLAGVSGAGYTVGGHRGRSPLVRANVTPTQTIIRETALKLQSTHLAIYRQTDDIYRQIVAEASRIAVAGGETRKQAAQRMLNRFADHGITGFVDRAGRNWSIDTYVDMAARTALSRAAVQGFIDTQLANGNDLVLVSDVPEECELCAPYEGRVLSITGATSGIVKMGDGSTQRIAGTVAEATANGLFHPNCRHRLTTFLPGYTKPLHDTADPVGYEQRQEQRYIERNIRKWKRRETVALDPQAKAQAAAKRKQWQERARQFTEETGRRRDYSREQVRTGTAGASVPPPVRQMRPSEEIRVDRRMLKAARDEIAQALAAVDRIHTLPESPERTPVRPVYVQRDSRLGDFNPNRNSRIGIRTELPNGYPAHYGMTFLHELGHLIDFEVAGRNQAYGTYLSRFNTPAHWQAFWDAIIWTEWFRTVHAIRQHLRFTGAGYDLAEQLDYLLDPAEMWARAYSQYVAGRSGNAMLMRELRMIPTLDTVSGFQTPVQWTDQDFAQIAIAVENVLRAEGLMD